MLKATYSMYKNPYIKIQPKTRRPYTEVYLIRHCNPDYSLEKKLGEQNMPLSVIGIKQRKHLTKKLLTLGIEVAYTSQIVRAKETASTFLRQTKKKEIIDERINEINWKHWQRIKYFHMTEREREKRLESHRTLDRMLDKMQTTARGALSDIYHNNKGKRIAVFSHGNFIKALLTNILNADVIGFLSLEIFQSSISKLVIDRDGYVKISHINDVNHLPTTPIRDLFLTSLED